VTTSISLRGLHPMWKHPMWNNRCYGSTSVSNAVLCLGWYYSIGWQKSCWCFGLGIRAFCSRNFVLFYWFTYLNSTVKLFIPNLPCDGCTLVMTVFAIVFSLSPWDHAMFIADKVCFFCPSGFYYFLQHQVCVSTDQPICRVPRQKEGHSVDPLWIQRHTNQTEKFKR
jgi:hypothetical protein